MRFDRPGQKRPEKFRPPTECRAVGCRKHQMPGVIMCAAHWRMLPLDLRERYSLTAERTDARLAAISDCVRYVAEIEGPIA